MPTKSLHYDFMADSSYSADGNRTTSGFTVTRRQLFDLLQFEPQCVPGQRSPRARLNSPEFADMLVMEPTARDHAAMQRFRSKAGSPPVYFVSLSG
jgi:hypothetical protein